GTLASAAKRTPSIAIITRRLRRRSTHGPSGTATTAPTAKPDAASSDTANGPACNAKIATIGKASNASQVPKVLTANAAHSHPNESPGESRRTFTTMLTAAPARIADTPQSPPRAKKNGREKGGTKSSPLSTYSAGGGLPQGPGR